MRIVGLRRRTMLPKIDETVGKGVKVDQAHSSEGRLQGAEDEALLMSAIRHGHGTTF